MTVDQFDGEPLGPWLVCWARYTDPPAEISIQAIADQSGPHTWVVERTKLDEGDGILVFTCAGGQLELTVEPIWDPSQTRDLDAWVKSPDDTFPYPDDGVRYVAL